MLASLGRKQAVAMTGIPFPNTAARSGTILQGDGKYWGEKRLKKEQTFSASTSYSTNVNG
jgi:hypothetical protein